MIEIENVVKEFGRKGVINGIDLRIEKGDYLVILGPNGAGKTTLLKLISTLLRPSEGTIKIDGYDVKEDGVAVRRRIGVLGHVSYLYDELSAFENLRFYAKMYGVTLGLEEIRAILSRVKLAHRMNDLVGTYSRGMKQRLAIARAIIHKPKILLLDEPYTGLDLNGRKILTEMLRGFQKQGITTVMVTHDIERGYEMGNRLAVIIDGKIAADLRKEDMSIEDFKNRYAGLMGAT
ncbi:MAG: heme ABC exporter ATP-binding protein CcmA [Thermoplasmata archaeon]|nr:heme ABC exporter ATP-binding protein CcmA [Thermoplasmata archaeon]